MTRYFKWAGILAALILIYSCFQPWVHILSRNITITGIDPAGTNYGKPGYFHWVLAFVFLMFTLIPRIWAKRLNLAVCALNIGWAIRNFLIIGLCEGGECPVKKLGIYLALVSSIIMLISSLFPDMKLKEKP